MSTIRMKCPFCHHRYIRAGAYEKPLESCHLDIYKNLFLLQTDLLRPPSPSVNLTGNEEVADDAFGFNKSDYMSSPADSEPEHDSDREEIPVSRSHSSNTPQIR